MYALIRVSVYIRCAVWRATLFVVRHYPKQHAGLSRQHLANLRSRPRVNFPGHSWFKSFCFRCALTPNSTVFEQVRQLLFVTLYVVSFLRQQSFSIIFRWVRNKKPGSSCLARVLNFCVLKLHLHVRSYEVRPGHAIFNWLQIGLRGAIATDERNATAKHSGGDTR